MSPSEENRNELQRLRDRIANGEPIDWKQEMMLADFDDAIAEAVYTQQAIDRVKAADDDLERTIRGEANI